MNEIKDLSNEGLIRLYSNIIKELKNREIIRSKNIIGDLGEYLAIYHYKNIPGMPNLLAAPTGTQNIDAISRNGERYSIKSTSNRTTGVFHGLNDIHSKNKQKQIFEYVIIVIFKEDFVLDKIIELDWELFLEVKKWHKTMRAWNISITNDVLNKSKEIFNSNK